MPRAVKRRSVKVAKLLTEFGNDEKVSFDFEPRENKPVAKEAR